MNLVGKTDGAEVSIMENFNMIIYFSIVVSLTHTERCRLNAALIHYNWPNTRTKLRSYHMHKMSAYSILQLMNTRFRHWKKNYRVSWIIILEKTKSLVFAGLFSVSSALFLECIKAVHPESWRSLYKSCTFKPVSFHSVVLILKPASRERRYNRF